MSEVKRGRPLARHVRHEERKCNEHGLTLHGQYLSGTNDQLVWSCLLCAKERMQNARRKPREIRGPRRKVPSRVGETCEDCKQFKSLSGVCDFCD